MNVTDRQTDRQTDKQTDHAYGNIDRNRRNRLPAISDEGTYVVL